jgi:hypothetical protein
LGLDIVDALSDYGVGGYFVGSLEDGSTPAGGEGVGLVTQRLGCRICG